MGRKISIDESNENTLFLFRGGKFRPENISGLNIYFNFNPYTSNSLLAKSELYFAGLISMILPVGMAFYIDILLYHLLHTYYNHLEPPAH